MRVGGVMSDDTTRRGRRWRLRVRRVVVWTLWCGLGLAYLAVGFALVWRDEPGSMTRSDAALTFGALLIETFAFHAGLVMVAAVGVALALRAWGLVVASVPMVVWCLGPAVWLCVRPGPGVVEGDGATLTVMSANLMYGRADAAALAGLIERERPDVVCLQEYTPAMHARLEPLLRGAYGHVVTWQREDAFGQAVFSRLAFVGEAEGVPGVGEWRMPQGSVVVEVGGERVRVVNVHVLPPAALRLVQEQRRQVAWLAEDVEERGGAVVLAGDFNAPIWTGHLRELRAAGLEGAHAARGVGRGSTWPGVGWKRWAPGIRLDHVLFGGGVGCVEARVLEGVGSDHRPVVARLRVLGANGG